MQNALWQPLSQRWNRPPHFKVKYKFYTKAEGGRSVTPVQGYRSDFWYEHPGGPRNLFMIYPEFEDEYGNVITDRTIHVPEEGIAGMWITVQHTIPYHQEHLKVGMTGYFMEGGTRVAECEVIEMLI